MKRRFKLLSVLISFVLFVSGCGCNAGKIVVDKETKRKPSTGASWTVMIYMSASTMEDNYKRAGEVLASLSYDLPENINVVVEVGGCQDGWEIDGIKNDKIQDFVVQKNGIRPIDEKPLANMGDGNTYADFLKRTIKKFPADRYVSVIWGDGGGPVNGVAYDSMYAYDSLTPNELAQALKKVGTKMDILGFDASLMSNLETASAVAPYVKYMVASEDVMPITGWDYRLFFEFISNNPSAKGKDVGKVICDGVMEYTSKEYKNIVSMAVIDLSKIGEVTSEFKRVTQYMNSACDDMSVLRSMTAQINHSPFMGANSSWEGCSELVDLKAFAKAVGSATLLNDDVIGKKIDTAVVYKTMSELHASSCGLNVYYPKNRSVKRINKYKEMSISPDYEEYIDKTTVNKTLKNRLADYKDTPSWQRYEKIAPKIKLSAEADLAGKYLLNVSNTDTLTGIGVNLYKYYEEEGLYIHLRTDYNINYSNITNIYEYELNSKQLEMNGIPVDSYIINRMGNINVYSIPVIYDGIISNIRVLETETDTEDENKYTVLGIWEGIGKSTGLAHRKYKIPQAGDTITPIYSVYRKSKYVEGKSLTIVFGGLSIKEKPLDDGQYIISYEVEDMYGKRIESNITNVTAIKGKMQISK